eukprot:3571359-Rhodomonas_salina.5
MQKSRCPVNACRRSTAIDGCADLNAHVTHAYIAPRDVFGGGGLLRQQREGPGSSTQRNQTQETTSPVLFVPGMWFLICYFVLWHTAKSNTRNHLASADCTRNMVSYLLFRAVVYSEIKQENTQLPQMFGGALTRGRSWSEYRA